MKSVLGLWVLSLTVLTSCIALPDTVTHDDGTTTTNHLAYDIPFGFEAHHIYIPIQINGTSKRWFILDSGAANTFITATQAQALGMRSQDPSEIAGIGPKRLKATKVGPMQLNLLGVEWGVAGAIAAPAEFFEPLSQHFGRQFQGVLGADLFERFVVEIDYEQQLIRLYEPPTYQYQGNGEIIPLKLINRKPYILTTVTVSANETINSTLLVDLGSGTALSLRGIGPETNNPEITVPKALKRSVIGVGGEKPVYVSRVARLELGNIDIQRPVTLFTPGHGEQKELLSGSMGNRLFKRFKVILNYTRRQLILEPNQFLDQPYEYDMSGLWLEATGADLDIFRVKTVFADSPAAQVDLQPGDIITQVDGQSVSTLKLEQVQERLIGDGQVRQLTVQRRGQSMQIQLQLQRQI